jgi:ParB family transcriptional regulator, chromosome partitioning protein
MSMNSVIRLDLLKPHPENVRKTNRAEGIEALASNIHANGLINGLTVVENGGDYLVIAGARRLAALQLLLKQKKLDAHFDVPCTVYDRTDPNLAEISLSENEMRQAMHPADQFEAFKKLVEEGKGRDTIAALYGVTPHVVDQRLKLANVSPKLIKIYRDGGMSLEQVMAFSLTTDQKRQEKAWHGLPKYAKEQQRADTVRRALTEKHIPSDNDLAAFVGASAYEAAGGQVLRDLFTDGDGADAYFANAQLLDKLAGEKLELVAETVRAEGWKWVSVIPDLSWEEQRKYMRRTIRHSHTAEERAEAARLGKEIVTLEKVQEAQGGFDADLAEKIDALREKLDAAEEGTEQWTAKDRELSGAIVTIEDGKAHILRGMMKADEVRAARKVEAAAAKPGSKAKSEEKRLSQALVETLTSLRTVEIQRKLIDNPKVALVAAVHALVQTVAEVYGGSPVQMKGEREIPRDEAAAKSEAAKAVAIAVKGLPNLDDPLKLWALLYRKDQAQILKMLAVCVGATFDAIHMQEPDPKERDVADFVAGAVKLDMAKHWEATTAGYFSRVPSALITAAVTEACGKAEAAKLSGMKKADAAKAAERMVKGKGWLPRVLKS